MLPGFKGLFPTGATHAENVSTHDNTHRLWVEASTTWHQASLWFCFGLFFVFFSHFIGVCSQLHVNSLAGTHARPRSTVSSLIA